MKKNVKGLIVTAVIALLAGYGISRSMENNAPELSATTLANIEAISQDESGGGYSESWSCWSNLKAGEGVWVCGNPCFFKDGCKGRGSADSTCLAY